MKITSTFFASSIALSIEEKKEPRFILSRLTTVDQQFCLEQIRYLYQTYFDLGSQHQVWPVSSHILLFIFLSLTPSF